MQWVERGGQLHYVSFEQLLLSAYRCWQQTPGLFRPDRLLDILFKLSNTPLDDIYPSFAVLVWLPQKAVK